MDGVIEMSNLGSRAAGPVRPIVPEWSNDSTCAPESAWTRTVADSIREELDEPVVAAGTVWGQLTRLAFPIGIGSQGVMLEKGYDALRISGSGELPPSGPGPVADIDEDRLGGLGRATLRTLTALDLGGRPGALALGLLPDRREPGRARLGARAALRNRLHPPRPSSPRSTPSRGPGAGGSP